MVLPDRIGGLQPGVRCLPCLCRADIAVRPPGEHHQQVLIVCRDGDKAAELRGPIRLRDTRRVLFFHELPLVRVDPRPVERDQRRGALTGRDRRFRPLLRRHHAADKDLIIRPVSERDHHDRPRGRLHDLTPVLRIPKEVGKVSALGRLPLQHNLSVRFLLFPPGVKIKLRVDLRQGLNRCPFAHSVLFLFLYRSDKPKALLRVPLIRIPVPAFTDWKCRSC